MQTLLAKWTAVAATSSATQILPDGCRDLICWERPGIRPFWFISPLQTAAKPAVMRTGDRLSGFRLVPGASIEESALLQAVQGCAPDPDHIATRLADFTRQSAHVQEALACLGQAVTIASAARDLGTSMRRLQRLTHRETGQSPGFWFGLARVRNAARLITAKTPLAETAFTAGFADQAHMTREFRRWFGVTPRGFLSDPRLISQAGSLAYG